MKVYNTKGELLTNISLDAEDERAGQNIVFVVDTEVSELLTEVLKQLKIMNTHLALGSDEELNEEESE